MVRRTPVVESHHVRPESYLDRTAEEYYKNDYPDEESSDYDASEGSDGASPSVFSLSLFSLVDAALCTHRPHS